MTQVVRQNSHLPHKKSGAVIDGKKTIPFGLKNACGFTLYKDPERKARYTSRHKKNERWDNPTTAGFYSRWILWNQPTLQKPINDLNKHYKSVNCISKS